MEPIVVPAPPKSAFNKHRRVSDLLLGQLKHFQHVERKNGIRIDAALGREIHTEAGAARYIAEITRAIRAQSKAGGIAVVPDSSSRRRTAPAEGLALAASAEEGAASEPDEEGKP